MALHRLKHLVTWFLLLSIISSLSHAKAKTCKCPAEPDQDRRSNNTMDDSVFLSYWIDKDSGIVQRVSLDLLRNLSDADVNNTEVLSIFPGKILSQVRPDGMGVDEASFSVNIVYQPLPDQSQNGLVFLILPYTALEKLSYDRENNRSLARDLVARNTSELDLFNVVSQSASVLIRIGVLPNLVMVNNTNGSYYYNSGIMVVEMYIDDPVAVISNYSVWIDYDPVRHSMSVYVDVEGKPKPTSTKAESDQNIVNLNSPFFYFGLLSTTEQLLGAGDIKWSATVDDLPVYPNKGGHLSRKVTILSSVLGSIAATVGLAAALACYFNSRYRRWHKDLEQLARSMERLPGVPVKIDYADIYKATRNFHEDMKLGRGGFGTVYKCTLPAAASKMERPMDVAVKRFTRDVQNHRYDDFLAEVSIINRLRHKNIVPLIGWSYNKGVPLLVFEFMTNGSLDQHLFHSSGNTTRQRNTDDTIRKWATRYEIVKGIATALHYVHHEYEPMVLHRDIKVSNIMLDSSFQSRLGDFGLACTVAVERNSVTGVGGTWGYIAPEYPVCRKATRQTDIYALGVLILEVVTGLRALADHEVVDDDDMHITDRVWRLHREGRLLECVDAMLIDGSSLDDEEQLDTAGDAKRLLLLGLACSNPNPLDRPTMPDVVRVIAKSTPPPQVPSRKPRFMWPPQEEGCSVASDDNSVDKSMTSNLNGSMVSATRGHDSFQIQHSACGIASSASRLRANAKQNSKNEN